MQYALLYIETADEMQKRADPAAAGDYWAAWSHYMDTMREAGVMRGGNALEPPATGTAVHHTAAGRVVEDGPFAEAREELGGYVIIETDGIDAAIEFAAAAPCAKPGCGRVDVRPVMTMSN